MELHTVLLPDGVRAVKFVAVKEHFHYSDCHSHIMLSHPNYHCGIAVSGYV